MQTRIKAVAVRPRISDFLNEFIVWLFLVAVTAVHFPSSHDNYE
jgi:hypothetical protein